MERDQARDLAEPTHPLPIGYVPARAGAPCVRSIQLHGELIEGIVGKVDWKALAAGQMKMSRANYEALLSDPLVHDPRIHHVRFTDFVADPVGTIRGFYEFCGLPFTPAFEAAMRDYLAVSRGDRYGKFEYSTDIIGEDVTSLAEEFSAYRERFGITSEKVRS